MDVPVTPTSTPRSLRAVRGVVAGPSRRPVMKRLSLLSPLLALATLVLPATSRADLPFKIPIPKLGGGNKAAPARTGTSTAATMEKGNKAAAPANVSAELNKTATAKNKEIAAQLAKPGDPVSEENLVAYRAAIDALNAVQPDVASWHDREYTHFRLSNAWRQADQKAQFEEVAKILEGKLIKGEVTSGKKMNVSFKGEKGWCYSVHMRWANPAGTEKFENFEWSAKGGNSALQRYQTWETREVWQTTLGVCTTKASDVTATADLQFAGTRNGIKYAVVGWPKEKFPQFEATYMGVTWGDMCDVDGFKSLWTDPIPGSLVYDGQEPFLITGPDRAGQTWLSMMNATGTNSVRTQKRNVTSKAPAARSFRTQYRFPGCSREKPETAESKKLAACHQKIDQKYQAQWDKASDEKNRARTVVQLEQAQGKLDRLRELDTNDRVKQCDPVEDAISKKWEKMFNGIVDHYADNAYTEPLDRAGRLNSEENAFK
jgi:hypothetical protein